MFDFRLEMFDFRLEMFDFRLESGLNRKYSYEVDKYICLDMYTAICRPISNRKSNISNRKSNISILHMVMKNVLTYFLTATLNKNKSPGNIQSSFFKIKYRIGGIFWILSILELSAI